MDLKNKMQVSKNQQKPVECLPILEATFPVEMISDAKNMFFDGDNTFLFFLPQDFFFAMRNVFFLQEKNYYTKEKKCLR